MLGESWHCPFPFTLNDVVVGGDNRIVSATIKLFHKLMEDGIPANSHLRSATLFSPNIQKMLET